MTTPPINDNINKLFLTDTFYSWFLKTNDLVDKVNPISLYGISADSRNPAPDGKNYDGITIADIGEGYYRIGYHLPTTIVGSTHEFKEWLNVHGISGTIVNTINGRTGDLLAVQAASGRTADIVTGNLERVIFSVNGFTGTTAGVIEIPGLITGTYNGNAGDILVINDSAGGSTFDNVPFIEDYNGNDDGTGTINQMGFKLNVTDENAAIMLAGNKNSNNPFYYYTGSNVINHNYNSADESGTIIHIPALGQNLGRVTIAIPTHSGNAAGILFTAIGGAAMAAAGNLNIRTGHRLASSNPDYTGWRDLDYDNILSLDNGLNIITNPYTWEAAGRQNPDADGSTTDRGTIAARFDSGGRTIFNYSDYSNPQSYSGVFTKSIINDLVDQNLNNYRVSVVSSINEQGQDGIGAALNAIFPYALADGSAYVADWKIKFNLYDGYVQQKFRSRKGMRFQWEPQSTDAPGDYNSILMTPYGNLVLGWPGDGHGNDDSTWLEVPTNAADIATMPVDAILTQSAIKMHGFGSQDGLKGQIQTVGGFENVYTDALLGGFNVAQNYFRLNTNFENCNITAVGTNWDFTGATSFKIAAATNADIDMGYGTLTLGNTVIEAYNSDTLDVIGPPVESGQILVSTKKGDNQAVKWETAANVKEWSFGLSTGRVVYGCYFKSARLMAQYYTQGSHRSLSASAQSTQLRSYKKINRHKHRVRPPWYYVYSNRTLGKEAGGVTYSNMMYHAYQDFWDYQDNFMGSSQSLPVASNIDVGVPAFPTDNTSGDPPLLNTSGCTLSDIVFKAFASGGYKNFGLPIPSGPVSKAAGGIGQNHCFGRYRDHDHGYHMRPWPVQSRANLNLWWGLSEPGGNFDDVHQSCYLDDQYQHGAQGAGKHKFDWWRRILEVNGQNPHNGSTESLDGKLVPSDIFSGPYSHYYYTENAAFHSGRVNAKYKTYKDACVAEDFGANDGNAIHKAMRSDVDLAPNSCVDTIHHSIWGAAAKSSTPYTPMRVDMVFPQTPFSAGAWGWTNYNWSTLFQRYGHASHPYGGSSRTYQKYPSICYEHPNDLVGSYAMTWLGELIGGPPRDGSKYLTKIKLKWKCANGMKIRFMTRPCWTDSAASFTPERWTWGCYRRFYETFGGSGGYVQNNCDLWRSILNEITSLDDGSSQNITAKACVSNAIAYPLQFYSDGKIRVSGSNSFCTKADGTIFNYKGAGTDPSDGPTSPQNRRFNFRYYDSRPTNTIFRQTVQDFPIYGGWGAYFQGFTMDNYDGFLSGDDRFNVMSERHIIDMDSDNRNSPMLPLWDMSRAYLSGEKSLGAAGDKRREHRWLKRSDGSIVTAAAPVLAADIATTSLEQGPNDSIYPSNNFAYKYNGNGDIVGLEIASFGLANGGCHQSPLATNQWYLTHTFKDFGNTHGEDSNDVVHTLYDGDLIGGFQIYYNFQNAVKPRCFTEYLIDTSDNLNPHPDYYGEKVGKVFGSPTAFMTEGVFDIENISKLEGSAPCLPILITSVNVNADFEFDCNEWSPLHASATTIGNGDSTADVYRQFYTDTDTDEHGDSSGWVPDGKIRRSAAGWSARNCVGGPPEGAAIIHGSNYPANLVHLTGGGAGTAVGDGLYDYDGVLEYDNDLAQRRDIYGNPVKVYEQFFIASDGSVRLYSGTCEGNSSFYMTVDDIIISR